LSFAITKTVLTFNRRDFAPDCSTDERDDTGCHHYNATHVVNLDGHTDTYWLLEPFDR